MAEGAPPPDSSAGGNRTDANKSRGVLCDNCHHNCGSQMPKQLKEKNTSLFLERLGQESGDRGTLI